MKMLNIDDSKLPDDWETPVPVFCPVCYKLGYERMATDWDHIKHFSLGSMGGRQHYFNKDDVIIPLCREHHSERHNLGLTAFERKYGKQELYELTQNQADDRNLLHYRHQPKHKNRGIR
ncbi:hypothetical protein vBOeSunk162_38 [Oenococcus phage vB_OeS_unk162]|nr:hypothetical protein vBOeSunk162_38 [Oenococcus phage vB_OeS_unk162]